MSRAGRRGGAAVVGAVALLSAAFVAGHLSAPPQSRHGDSSAAGVWEPPPTAGLVPAGSFVTSEQLVRMDPGSVVPQLVVTTRTTDDHSARESFQIFAWNGASRRWAVVFDAMATPLPDAASVVSLPPDLFGGHGDGLSGDQPLLPTDSMTVDQLTVEPIAPGPGPTRDLVVNVNVGNPYQVLAVLRWVGARIIAVYRFNSSGFGGIDLTGAASGETLTVSSQHYAVTDAHCCPSRDFRLDLAVVPGSADGRYEPVADDRAWTGAYAKVDDADSAVVVKVTGGSPADGRLRVGDRVLGVHGRPRTEKARPTLWRDLAKTYPAQAVALDVARGGATIVVQLEMTTLLTARDEGAGPPAPLGADPYRAPGLMVGGITTL